MSISFTRRCKIYKQFIFSKSLEASHRRQKKVRPTIAGLFSALSMPTAMTTGSFESGVRNLWDELRNPYEHDRKKKGLPQSIVLDCEYLSNQISPFWIIQYAFATKALQVRLVLSPLKIIWLIQRNTTCTLNTKAVRIQTLQILDVWKYVIKNRIRNHFNCT